MEYQNVDKKVKTLWCIRRSILTIIFLVLFGCFLFSYFSSLNTEDEFTLIEFVVWLSVWGIFFLSVVGFAYILPSFQYKVYKYKITENEFFFNSGVIFKSEHILPFCQIQDFNITQGPIESIVKLKSLTISTASSPVVISGLNSQDAIMLEKILSEKVRSKLENESNKGE